MSRYNVRIDLSVDGESVLDVVADMRARHDQSSVVGIEVNQAKTSAILSAAHFVGAPSDNRPDETFEQT